MLRPTTAARDTPRRSSSRATSAASWLMGTVPGVTGLAP